MNARRLTALVAALAGTVLTTTTITSASAAPKAPSRIAVNAPNKVQATSTFKVKGRVTTRGKARTVRVAVKKNGRWVTQVRKKTKRGGAFTVKLKAPSKASKMKIRVVAPRTPKLKKARRTVTVTVNAKPPTNTPVPGGEVDATWETTTVFAGPSSSNTVFGTHEDAANEVVNIEQRYRDGWRTVASTTLDSTGQYRVAVPASFYSRFLTRVTVPSTGATSGNVTVNSTPSFVPRGDASAWSGISKNNRYRWDPCTTRIRYRTNMTQAAPSTDAVLKSALRKISLATGLRFRYVGDTTAHSYPSPGTPERPDDADLLISFSRQSETMQPLSGYAGWGGPDQGTWGEDHAGEVIKISSSSVLINAELKLKGADLERVLMHEIGHAVGAGHTDSEHQIMGARFRGSYDQVDFGAGDLTGLERLGAVEGCIRERRYTFAPGLHFSAPTVPGTSEPVLAP